MTDGAPNDQWQQIRGWVYLSCPSRAQKRQRRSRGAGAACGRGGAQGGCRSRGGSGERDCQRHDNVAGPTDTTHPLNRPIAAKLVFEVLLVDVVAEPSNDHGLEWVAADVGVVLRLVCARVTPSAPSLVSLSPLLRHPSPPPPPHSRSAPSALRSAISLCAAFLRSRASSQLSVGSYVSVSLYSCSAGRNAPMPLMVLVRRFSMGWSGAATHCEAGEGQVSIHHHVLRSSPSPSRLVGGGQGGRNARETHSQRRTRRKERQKVGRQPVGHGRWSMVDGWAVPVGCPVLQGAPRLGAKGQR
jgi:hypothetical protein